MSGDFYAETELAGQDWTSDQLDIIVADYFDMLGDDLSHEPYNKAEHNRRVQALTHRSHGSIERKHQNISAVLKELGMPWIFGYKPLSNYQTAIIDAIDRRLSVSTAIVDRPPAAPEIQSLESLFVAPPALTLDPVPPRLRRIVRKFDPTERDQRNRNLGKAGEEFVLEVERRRLIDAGRSDLSKKVCWVSNEEGDGAGYDILSFNLWGMERLLEIKTTNGAAKTPFFLSRNELDLSNERPNDWQLYRVHSFSQTPQIFILSPPLGEVLHLTPEAFRASF